MSDALTILCLIIAAVIIILVAHAIRAALRTMIYIDRPITRRRPLAGTGHRGEPTSRHTSTNTNPKTERPDTP